MTTTLPTTSQLSQLSHRFQVLYALRAAKLVIHLAKSEEAKAAVSTVESWLAGTATGKECRVAANAAYAADATAAADAAHAAAAHAAAAAYAANAANAAAAYANVKQQLVDYYSYYSYLATMSERVDNILRAEA